VQFVVPDFFTLLYPQSIKSLPRLKGKLFFTFDDGPNPSVTPEILDILKEYNAKATFFCLGENVEKYPELYNRILNEGHITGNHSFSHLNGLKHNTKKYLEDIERARQYIFSDFFRPPYGKLTPMQYRRLVRQYRIVFWDVMAFDFKENLQASDCIQRVVKDTKDGSIIVFHDNNKARERVLKALPSVLAHFGRLAFTFESLTLV
jgi:peptidoglycan-N-acetylglucosamine deacetylase